MVQELNWSADTMLLGAAIHDCVAIFDMNKILQRTTLQSSANGAMLM